MVNNYFLFDVQPKYKKDFLHVLNNVYIPLYEKYSNYVHSEFWEIINKTNCYLYTSKWSDENKQNEMLSNHLFQEGWIKTLTYLNEQPQIYRFKRVPLDNSLVEAKEIIPFHEESMLKRRAIILTIKETEIDLFIKLCNSHTSFLNTFKGKITLSLYNEVVKYNIYCLSYFWINEEEEMKYYNSSEFQQFWKVVNSILTVSPFTLLAERMHFKNSKFGT